MPRRDKRYARVAETFGALLKSLRAELDLTQEEFAHRLGTDLSFLARMERGTTQPSIGMFLQISDGLGLRPGELMSRIESKVRAQLAGDVNEKQGRTAKEISRSKGRRAHK